jgi:dipeptidyl aminopeptidase/acylaminoacyl peptidase
MLTKQTSSRAHARKKRSRKLGSTVGAALVPRATLFGNQGKSRVQLSPCGEHLAYLAPLAGALNLWIRPVLGRDEAVAVTDNVTHGLQQYFWSADGRYLLLLEDTSGEENWQLVRIDMRSREKVTLASLEGVQAGLVGVSHQRPGVALIRLNHRNHAWHDLYEVDLLSGERTLVEQNDQQFVLYLPNLRLQPCLALRALSHGGGELCRGSAEGWVPILEYAHGDSLTTQPLVVEGNGKTALLLTAAGRDKVALVRVELASGTQSVVAEDARADIVGAWIEPKSLAPQAYVVDYLTPQIEPLTSEARIDLETLREAIGPYFRVLSRALEDHVWVIATNEPASGGASYLYSRRAGKVTRLFSYRRKRSHASLCRMWPLELRARDGLTLTAYLTLPCGCDGTETGRPEKPVALVLNVHGGPWARDVYGFSAEHQWLANRGYAVLSVNYRGSSGFGKSFMQAADRQWAGKVCEDLLDAIDWAIREKIALADKIAIFGVSFGGYAVLTALGRSPERFACGVAFAAPPNLRTLFDSLPPLWTWMFEDLAKRVGDPRTEEGRALLDQSSPLTRAERIAQPLLIGHGCKDPRFKQAESEQMVASMQAHGRPVTYVIYPDEGHTLMRPQNRIAFYALAESFLAQHLGGRCEDLGEELSLSSARVTVGAHYLRDITQGESV